MECRGRFLCDAMGRSHVTYRSCRRDRDYGPPVTPPDPSPNYNAATKTNTITLQ
jgi:hypothetical protein